MDKNPAFVILGMASLLLIALLVGRLVAKIRIPRVTGYLVTGILIGPSLAHWLNISTLLSYESIASLQTMTDIALVLIILTIGMRFRSENIRRWRTRIFIFSASEILLTSILVGGTIFVVNYFFFGYTISEFGDLKASSMYIAVILGILAIETAPAATMLVIREYESEGPITDAVSTLIGINNLTIIIAFNIAIHYMLVPDEGLVHLIFKIFTPLGIGSLIGFVMSGWAQKLNSVPEYQLLVLGGVLLVMGSCRILGYDFLLGCFACGVVLVNSSPKAGDIFDAIKKLDYALYVIFFVIAGASLHLDALTHIGILGIVYLVCRTLGKFFGSKIGATLGKFNLPERKYTGMIMLAQAGVAIGLCQALLKMDAPGAKYISTVVFGAVVVFELIGPLGIRYGLVHAGEVPLLTLLAKKAPLGSFEGLHQIVNFFRNSIGIPQGHNVGSAKDILVKHIMRQNVNTIDHKTPFNDLLHMISHSRYDRFPIINDEGRFLGVIDYEDIRDILFDPFLSQLVVAHDLVKKVALVTYPNSTLGDVLNFFKSHPNISYLPVVDDCDPEKLMGMVSQNDVLATFRKFNK